MRPAFRPIRTRRHNERVSALVREVVVLLEHGKLDRAKVLRDLGEREPADLDEAEERLGREQAVVLVRVAHVPVRTAMSDGTGSNTSGALHALGTADSCAKSRTLIPATRRLSLRSSGVSSTTGRSVVISVGTGETGSGGWEEDDSVVEVASVALRSRLGRAR